MMAEAGADAGALQAMAKERQGRGETAMFVAIDGKAAGIIAVADPIKTTTEAAIRALHEEGLRVIMLTGDSRTTAEAVASRLGIDAVIAEVLPEDKHAAIQRLKSEGRIVAMAGEIGRGSGRERGCQYG